MIYYGSLCCSYRRRAVKQFRPALATPYSLLYATWPCREKGLGPSGCLSIANAGRPGNLSDRQLTGFLNTKERDRLAA
jgi:hypothetical protein